MPQAPAPTVEDLGPLEVEDLGPLEPEKKTPPETVQTADQKRAEIEGRRAALSETLKASMPGGGAAIGAGKRVIRDAAGAVLAVPGAEKVFDFINQRLYGIPSTRKALDTMLAPEGTSEKIGSGLVGAAEFMLPGAVAKGGRVAKAAIEVAGAYGVAKAQDDPHPLWAATMSAVLAPLGLISKAAPTKASAAKSMGKALSKGSDVTDIPFHRAVAESVDRALDLGWAPTWQKLLARAGAAKTVAGQSLKAVKAGPEGATIVSTKPVIDALDEVVNSAQNIVAVGKHGQPIGAGGGAKSLTTVNFDPRMVKVASNLKDIIEAHGPTMEASTLSKIKSNWSKFVWQGRKFDKPKLKLEAEAKDAAVKAMRDVFKSDTPTLAEADQKYHLARQTYDVIAEAAGLGKLSAEQAAAKSKIGQNARNTITAMGSAAGGGAGFATGHSMQASVIGAAIGGATARMLESAMLSPGWRLLTPYAKNAIAEAIASGNSEQVRQIIAPLLTKAAAGPSQ